MSAFANCGRAVAHVRGSYVPILSAITGSARHVFDHLVGTSRAISDHSGKGRKGLQRCCRREAAARGVRQGSLRQPGFSQALCQFGEILGSPKWTPILEIGNSQRCIVMEQPRHGILRFHQLPNKSAACRKDNSSR